jgi:hypothetical protein
LRELILGQIPDNFSPEKHIPIAPHCFVGKEHVYPNWYKELNFIEPFSTQNDIIKGDRITAEYARYSVEIISKKLNNENELNFPYKFWSTIIYPWLVTLIQLIYYRQQIILHFFKKFKSEIITVRICNHNSRWNFKDTLDFINKGCNSNIFNYWIYSIILKEMKKRGILSNVEIIEELSLPEVSNFSQINNSHFKDIKRRIGNLLLRTTPIFTPGYGINLADSYLFGLLLKFKKGSLLEDGCDLIIDKSLTNIFIVDIDEIIYQVIPDSIINIKNTINTVKLPCSKYIYVSNSLWYDDYYRKIIAAKAKTKGIKVIAAQHGGHNYGSALTCEMIYKIEYKSDYFITWGWNRQSDYIFNAIKLPSPMLSKIKDKHRFQNNKIIWVSTNSYVFSPRFQDVRPNYWIELRKFKEEIFNKIDLRIQKIIYYRPYFSEDSGIKDYTYYKEKYTWLKKLDDDFTKSILSCELLIIDHPGTTLNIAYSANIPTILVFPTGGYLFSPQSEEYFNEMIKLGLWIKDPLLAAERINSITDVKTWWCSEGIQKFRNEWIKKYALSCKHWRKEWIKKLWNM